MKIVSFGDRGQELPGVVCEPGSTREGHVIDLIAADPSIPPTVRGILEQNALDRVRGVLERSDALPETCLHRLDGVRLGPPITNPSKIICVGLNYSDHAAEQGRQVPDEPLTFAKGPNALSGNGDPIPIPSDVAQADHEVELAAVIGRRAKAVPRKNAGEYVAGFGVFMDISARDVQYREKQWFRAKSFDGFAPFGPWLTTSDSVDDPRDLDISLEVNGNRFQSSNTGLMTFDVDFLVSYLSRNITLEPGDIIATGTPAGVGVFASPQRFLKSGDTITATIEGLGTLTNPVK